VISMRRSNGVRRAKSRELKYRGGVAARQLRRKSQGERDREA
jgi:hypothetical protein